MWEIAVMVGVLGVTFVFLFLASMLHESHPPISLMLSMLTFVMIPVTLIILKFIVEPNSSVADAVITRLYIAAMIIMGFFLFWIFIVFLVNLLLFMKDRGHAKIEHPL